MYEQATANLSSQECKKVAQTLIKFQDTFSKDEWDLGVTHLTEHSIKTGDAQPVKQPPRRVLLAFARVEKKAIVDLKAKGVIQDGVYPGQVLLCLFPRKMEESVHVWTIEK